MARKSLWVLAAVLAGCTDPGPSGEGSAATPPELPPAFSPGSCIEVGGEFRTDAEAVAPSIPSGFELVRDATGTVVSMSVMALMCDGPGQFTATVPVVPPADMANASIGSYRLSEGGYVEGQDLFDYYERAGLSAVFTSSVLDLAEEDLAAQAAKGQASADTADGALTIDWTRTRLTQDSPAMRVRTFVADINADPPLLLGYCDEAWPARTVSSIGIATLGGPSPLFALAVPPGTVLAFGPAEPSFECRPV